MAFRHSLAAAVACWTAVFSSAGRAQLLGCDDVGCPQDSTSSDACPIGTTTAQAIGTTNFTSTLNPNPLTWTVAFSTEVDSTNSSVAVLERGYYLGTPPSLNLATTTGPKGCALFFEDVVERHEFSPPTAGTCRDFLGSSCVSDLISQANKTFSQILSDGDTNFVCSKLAVQLRDDAPSSCSLTDSGIWGAIAVQDITGSSLPSPITIDSTCNPTSEEDYSLTQIESQKLTTEPLSDAINSFAWGVTPILTIFYPAGSTSSNDGSDSDSPEFHLSCLKPVSQDAIVETIATTSGIASRSSPIFMMVAALIMLGVI